MIRITSLSLPLQYDDETLVSLAAKKLKIHPSLIASCVLARRAVDARKKDDVRFSATLDVTLGGDEQRVVDRLRDNRVQMYKKTPYVLPSTSSLSSRPVVIGAGPAGLFAALTLAKAGARPLLLERGEAVEDRRQAVETFQKKRACCARTVTCSSAKAVRARFPTVS